MPDAPAQPSFSCSIVGSGGHANVIAATLQRLNGRLEAVFDTDVARVGHTFCGRIIQVDGPGRGAPAHIAIGSNQRRRSVARQWEAQGQVDTEWRTLVHPEARVAEEVVLGHGSFVGMGSIVQTGTTIGRHVIINSGALVEHDCVIGDFVHVAPGAILGGAVRVGDEALIGIGSVVLPGISIGRGATIGAGAVVTRSVEADSTVVGVPARPV